MAYSLYSDLTTLIAEDLHEMEDIAQDIEFNYFIDTVSTENGFRADLEALFETKGAGLHDSMKGVECSFTYLHGVSCYLVQQGDNDHLFVNNTHRSLVLSLDESVVRQNEISRLKDAFEAHVDSAGGFDMVSRDVAISFVLSNKDAFKANQIPVESVIYFNNSQYLLDLGRFISDSEFYYYAGRSDDLVAEDIKEMVSISMMIDIKEFGDKAVFSPILSKEICDNALSDIDGSDGEKNLDNIKKEAVGFFRSYYQGQSCYYFQRGQYLYVLLSRVGLSKISDGFFSATRQSIIKEMRIDFANWMSSKNGAGHMSIYTLLEYVNYKASTIASGRIPIESIIHDDNYPWLMELGRALTKSGEGQKWV